MRSINEIINDLKQIKKTLIIGGAVVDIIISVDKLPNTGDDVTAIFNGQAVGGCAFNVADVLSKMDIDFELMIPIGNGIYGELVKKEIDKRKYRSKLKPIYDGDNGWCISLVEKNGERSFITVPGIETSMKIEWFGEYNVRDYDFFYLSGYEMEGKNGYIILDFLKNKKYDSKIIFDPGPRTQFIDKEVINKLMEMNTILTLNENEAFALSNFNDINSALKYLYNISKEAVVITLGRNGASVIENNEIINIDPFHTNVVDTIGAGDSHTGAILCGLCCGISLHESVYLANKIASIVVSKIGAANSPYKKDLL